MESGLSNTQNNQKNEPSQNNSIYDKKFITIFGLQGDSNNYMQWKKFATILELKQVPTSTKDLKEEINRTISTMEWIDLEEVLKIYTRKHNSKRNKPEASKSIPFQSKTN